LVSYPRLAPDGFQSHSHNGFMPAFVAKTCKVFTLF